MNMTDPLLSVMGVNPAYLVLIEYPAPRLLRLEDMLEDIDKLIKSNAFHFTDQSCMFLHTDDLESEGRCALVNVLRLLGQYWPRLADLLRERYGDKNDG